MIIYGASTHYGVEELDEGYLLDAGTSVSSYDGHRSWWFRLKLDGDYVTFGADSVAALEELSDRIGHAVHALAKGEERYQETKNLWADEKSKA